MRVLPLVAPLLVVGLLGAAETADTVRFNRDIRPILSENCFYCHGQDGNKRKADLRLDQKESAFKTGAIFPKDAAKSELVKRIHSDKAAELMPPAKSMWLSLSMTIS